MLFFYNKYILSSRKWSVFFCQLILFISAWKSRTNSCIYQHLKSLRYLKTFTENFCLKSFIVSQLYLSAWSQLPRLASFQSPIVNLIFLFHRADDQTEEKTKSLEFNVHHCTSLFYCITYQFTTEEWYPQDTLKYLRLSLIH